MDYLQSFIIGTSGPAIFQHSSALALADKNYYSYSPKLYSLLLPIYYGIMTMFALFLGKTFNLSLRKRLFITSIISIIFIVSLNYFYSRHIFKPYSEYDNKDWLKYILRNGARHLIVFNIIIYFLEEYFSKYFLLRVFIIGSSIFSYFITFIKVMMLDEQNKTNYDYNTFAAFEPFIQGFDLLVNVMLFHCLLKFNLSTTLVLWTIISSLLWLLLAYNYQTYDYQTKEEWMNAFYRVLLTGFVKAFVIYYLITLCTFSEKVRSKTQVKN